MTVLQHDPSAHAPWTSTIVGLSLMLWNSLLRSSLAAEYVRLSQPTLFQSMSQLRPSGNSKFWKDPIQVPTHGTMREEQALPNLAIGQALGRELCDLELLGSEAIPRVRCSLTYPHARRSKFLACTFAPQRCAERVEDLDAL